MENPNDPRKAELIKLKEQIGNAAAAQKVRKEAEKNRKYRASFNREEHEAFVRSRTYLSLLGAESQSEG